MIPPHNSLVKYDNPVLVSTTNNRSGKGGKKKGQAAPPAERQSSQTEDILNSILPPRCVTCARVTTRALPPYRGRGVLSETNDSQAVCCCCYCCRRSRLDVPGVVCFNAISPRKTPLRRILAERSYVYGMYEDSEPPHTRHLEQSTRCQSVRICKKCHQYTMHDVCMRIYIMSGRLLIGSGINATFICTSFLTF